MLKKNILSLLTIIIALSLIGCGRRPPLPPPTEVAVATVMPQRAVLTTELPGRTSAYRIAEIRPQVNGLIQKRLFTEGSDVNAGQILYQIDPAPFQATVNNAKASLNRAKALLPSIRSRVERYKELLTDNAVSQQEYDDATSSLNQTEAEIQYWQATVETANINLGYTSVTAPISGRIGKSSVTDGALVTAYQPTPLATIQQLNPIYVDVPQSTTEMLRLNRRLKDGSFNQNEPNQKNVKLFLEEGVAYPLDGKLQFRDITVDPTTGTVILRIVFPNPQEILLPGMFTRVIIEEGVQEQAILIPQQTVSRDLKGNPVVMIVDAENKVQPRPLALERAIGDQWLVSSGLSFGDRVIAEGLQKVRPGSVVKAIPFDAAGKNAKPGAQSRTNGGK
ncbi:MAG: efflux RND transporter periplasmic adaptor subunit [Phycisphaerae bacterium]